MKFSKKHCSDYNPTLTHPELVARVFPDDEFEVNIWKSIHGGVQVLLRHFPSGEAFTLTCEEELTNVSNPSQ